MTEQNKIARKNHFGTKEKLDVLNPAEIVFVRDDFLYE
jgi:hypothetical protein